MATYVAIFLCRLLNYLEKIGHMEYYFKAINIWQTLILLSLEVKSINAGITAAINQVARTKIVTMLIKLGRFIIKILIHKLWLNLADTNHLRQCVAAQDIVACALRSILI